MTYYFIDHTKDWALPAPPNAKLDINAPHSENYGLEFPGEINQVAVELAMFRRTVIPSNRKDPDDRFYHGIRAVSLLWPDGDVRIFAKGGDDMAWDGVIWNSYFLEGFKKLCDGEHLCMTGPGSAAKSFTMAIYSLICFFSAPSQTTFLISTTSSSASERRIFGYLKQLFNKASWKIGRVVDYLKCITVQSFDDDGKKTARDIANGIILVPIAVDSTGDNALSTIMGTHNTYVYWAIDELPAMRPGTMRPRQNLEANSFFQLVAAGNAQSKTDEHGLACEPEGGWRDILFDRSCVYKGKVCDVIFLNGTQSPNDHPSVKKELIKTKFDFPFPFLSNFMVRDAIAKSEGRGDLELGSKSPGFMRFAIGGFIKDEEASMSLLSEATIKRHKANLLREPWGPDGFKTFWGLDPDFSFGGDGCSISPILVGLNYKGYPQIVFPMEAERLKPIAVDKEDYRTALAMDVKKFSDSLTSFHPEYGCYDAMQEGGLLGQEMAELFGSNKIKPLTSLGESRDEECADMPTEYWLSLIRLIQTGFVREFNTHSGYFSDFSRRRFSTVKTKRSNVEEGLITKKIESKDEFRKRYKRSPNDGDSIAYASWHVIHNSGISFEKDERTSFERFNLNYGLIKIARRKFEEDSEFEEDQIFSNYFPNESS
jgi:hypothetical protein